MLNEMVSKYITGYHILAREFTDQYDWFATVYDSVLNENEDLEGLTVTSEEICEIVDLMVEYTNKIIRTSILQIATFHNYDKCKNTIEYYKQQQQEYKRIKNNVKLLTSMALKKGSY